MTVEGAPAPSGWAMEAGRFGVVGLIATLAHVLSAAALHYGLAFDALSANLFAFLAAFAISYSGNFHWTFSARGRHGAALWRFLAVSLVGLALNQTIVWWVTEELDRPFLLALVAVVLLVPALTFAAARSWAFVGHDRAAGSRGYGGSVVLIAVSFVGLLGYQLAVAPNHDVAWILTGTLAMLDGAQMGRDVVDVNPPLPWWEAALPTAYARLTGLDPATAFKLSIGALIVLGHTLSALLIRRGRWTLAALCIVPLLAAGYGFGQREHVMLIVALPYTLLIAARVRGQVVVLPLAIAIGAFGASGFLLKPFFLAVPAALELWLMWHRRSLKTAFRPETWTLGIAILAYLAAIAIFAPHYLSEIWPRVAVSYGAYGSDPLEAVRASLLSIGPALIGLAILTRTAPAGTRTQAFLVASAGAFVAMVVQGKGWSYHLIAVSGLLAMTGAVWLQRARRVSAPIRLGVSLALMVTLATPTVSHIANAFSANGNEAQVRALASKFGAGQTVFGFNTSPRLVHQAVLLAAANWTGRAGSLHFLPAGLDSTAGPQARANALEQAAQVMAMLERRMPDALLVDEAKDKIALQGREVDWLEWFADIYPDRFVALLALYDRGERIGDIRIYTLKR